VPLALALDAVAARLAAVEETVVLEDPTRWAYALREAVVLARPDVLVVGWDGQFELGALRAIVADAPPGGVADALADADGRLRDRLTAAALVSVIATLRGLFSAGPQVTVAVLGPATLAGALCGEGDDADEVADLCADQLVDLLGACVEAGATAVVLRDHAPPAGVDAHAARRPVARALAHQQVELFVVPDEDGVVELVPPATWLLGAESFGPEIARLRGLAAAGRLVLGDGPLPAGLDLERFQV